MTIKHKKIENETLMLTSFKVNIQLTVNSELVFIFHAMLKVVSTPRYYLSTIMKNLLLLITDFQAFKTFLFTTYKLQLVKLTYNTKVPIIIEFGT